MTGPVRISHHNVYVRPVKRKIIISPIPDHDISLLFGCSENSFVIHSGEDYCTHIDVWLIFLSLFNRTIMEIEILEISKSLYSLLCEIAIWHRMSNCDYVLVTKFSQYANNVSRCLAFPASCSYCTNGNDWFC